MKNVILYVRVSTDEQAGRGYSMRDQEQKLLNYCKINDLNVLEIFREDYSAKTFNRPEFKKLLAYCKKYKKDINQLIFIKWDRFSRNTTESYRMLGVFNQLAIQVNAIEQPLDLTIPEQGLMLAVYFSIPEVENHRRSLNVIAGMRRALKEGRYVGNAPRGYSNGVDSFKKPVLVPNEDAKFIKKAFELMAMGLYNQRQIILKLEEEGFAIAKTSLAKVFRNHLYYGGIFIKGYKAEKEILINGIHKAIISKELFFKVQDVLDNKNNKFKIKHKKINEIFPLKGFVLCPECNKPLTASSSKGRTKYYTYYHCISPCNTRYKLDMVDNWFAEFLKIIKLDDNIQQLFLEVIKEKLVKDNQSNSIGPKHHQQVKELESKLIKIQDMFIDDKLDKQTYEQSKNRYEASLRELKDKEQTAIDKKEIYNIYKEAFKNLSKLDEQYHQASVEDKRRLIGSIFPNNFQFEKNGVRTTDINPVLLKISSINGVYRGKIKKDKFKKMNLSLMVGDEGFEPPTLSV